MFASGRVIVGFPKVLEWLVWSADNQDMNISGRIENGVVVLDDEVALPEGARVVVVCPAPPKVHTAAVQRPVQLPIFPYDGPPDIELTNDRIAEILMAEDASG